MDIKITCEGAVAQEGRADHIPMERLVLQTLVSEVYLGKLEMDSIAVSMCQKTVHLGSYICDKIIYTEHKK